jgi:hypothetical protein
MSAAATVGVAFGAFTAGAEGEPPPVAQPMPPIVETPAPEVEASPAEPPPAVEPAPQAAALAIAAGPTHTCEREREQPRRSKRHKRRPRAARERAEPPAVAEDLFASRR